MNTNIASAKTCAHELGHALSLDHPGRQRFPNGVSCTEQHGSNNLMTGGVDAAGGGGECLEAWQVLSARACAAECVREFALIRKREGEEECLSGV